ncbi:MAG: hypothetical protein EB060_01025 [Proteobacteria bacterium]|nr:hypothetical protein [Pseudomonadota bacterium]
MDIQQLLWNEEYGWRPVEAGEPVDFVEKPIDAQLVLYFGAASVFEKVPVYEELKRRYPYAHIVGASSALQVSGHYPLTGAITATAIRFRDAEVRVASTELKRPEQSYGAGVQIGESLISPDLKAVLLLCDGTVADAGVIISAMVGKIGKKIPISGMVSSTGLGAVHTFTGADSVPEPGKIAAIGFYGKHVELNTAGFHSCVPMGAPHKITRAKGHIVYEMDGVDALSVYRKYVKEDTAEGDRMRLLFPFMMSREDMPAHGVLRSVVMVDEGAKALVLGGNAPEGRILQMMMSRPEHIVIDGEAAALAKARLIKSTAKGDVLALLAGDVSRAAAMDRNIYQETGYVAELLGSKPSLIGGYGNGMFMPVMPGEESKLHNYTTAIAVLQEV